jgi:hypothetical protein
MADGQIAGWWTLQLSSRQPDARRRLQPIGALDAIGHRMTGAIRRQAVIDLEFEALSGDCLEHQATAASFLTEDGEARAPDGRYEMRPNDHDAFPYAASTPHYERPFLLAT